MNKLWQPTIISSSWAREKATFTRSGFLANPTSLFSQETRVGGGGEGGSERGEEEVFLESVAIVPDYTHNHINEPHMYDVVGE
ncbi:MAG: hypothetical protein DSM106950_06110 [Stigonema ocellatum SAG 48.90 = DSM 106950]|nr:hypothetical protein [Stigonema ocellatum SAG 48.90 = DSM 106950]